MNIDLIRNISRGFGSARNTQSNAAKKNQSYYVLVAYLAILQEKQLSRQQLTQCLAVSHPTTINLVQKLKKAHLIEENGLDTESAIGRPISHLTLSSQNSYVLCIDLTRHDIYCCIQNLKLAVLHQFSYTLQPERSYAENLQNLIESLQNSVSDYLADCVRIAVSVPGVYHAETDSVFCYRMQRINDLKLVEIFQSAFGIPIFVCSDIDCLMYSELLLNSEVENTDQPIAYFYWDEGMSCISYHKGSIIYGAQQFAGEIGKVQSRHSATAGYLEDLYNSAVLLQQVATAEFSGLLSTAIQDIAEVLSLQIMILNPRYVIIGGNTLELEPDLVTRLQDSVIVKLYYQQHYQNLKFLPAISNDNRTGLALQAYLQFLQEQARLL